MSMSTNIIGKFLQYFTSLFCKKDRSDNVIEDPPIDIAKELAYLWNMIREQTEGNLFEPKDIKAEIVASFNRLKEHYTDEQLDNVLPKYVSIAVRVVHEPIRELIEHINESNYISLTKRLSDLSNSISKNERKKAFQENMEAFMEALYIHILDNLNAKDNPACLSLGNIAKRKGDYETARKWYERVIETDQPFNGITSLLACYETEIKAILSESRRRDCFDPLIWKKVNALNKCQSEIYEKWCGILRDRINAEETTEQYKEDYVTLMTGYARLERNRGDYDKAFSILDSIPVAYPGLHRVYAEKAMLYQFKPYNNHYYNLEKAIEAFKDADSLIGTIVDNSYDVKSRKSILMPLANTYFQAGRYEEAIIICDRVLQIDCKEQRAINLKDRILSGILSSDAERIAAV